MKTLCQHCGARIGRGTRRGLCWAHYRDRSVRALYPRLVPGPRPEPDREPDACELRETIAAQLRRLPKWWDAEYAREREKDYVPKLYTLVRCS